MFIRIILCTLLLNSLSANCLGQKTANYQPFTNNSSTDLQILSSIDSRLKTDIDQLKGPNRKYAADLYTERAKMIKEEFEEQLFITNEAAREYLNTLVAEIARANPGFAIKDLRIFFLKSLVAECQ